MDINELLTLITIVVSFILGFISKKNKWINNNLIPVQNLIIGIIMAIVNYIITKDINGAIAVSGLLAGGTYDLFNNTKKLIKEKEEKGE